MRNTIIIACAALLMTACRLETSDNGQLDGLWLLTTVDTLATGGRANVAQQQYTWAFQGRIMELRHVGSDGVTDIICQFSCENDRLLVSNPCHIDRKTEDPPVTDVDELRPFGLNSTTENFRVLSLKSSSSMVLSSERIVLSFTKF